MELLGCSWFCSINNFFFKITFFFIFYFVVVVRGFYQSGTESEDPSLETSYKDPLSCGECPFTGNFSP